jgi:hypothetical protein
MTSYRTADMARWGAGLGRNLTPTEADMNWWDAIQRIVALEALPDAPPAITQFSVDGASFYVHFDNAVVMGPYALPVALFNVIESGWEPTTAYEYLDVFTENGVLYVVMIDHVSPASFDPDANNGSGQNYYYPLLEPPGNSLPTGGAAGQILTKSESTNYMVTWSWRYPEGGTAGKVLIQQSSTQDDAEWGVLDAANVGFTPNTGGGLAAYDNVADALEALAGGALDAYGIPFVPGTGSGLESETVGDALNELATSGSAGRQTMWVPAKGMTPLLSPYGAASGVFMTSDYNMVSTYDFDDTDSEAVQFEVAMPKSWDRSELTFKVYWSHGSTTVNYGVTWQIYAESFGNASNLDESLNADITISDAGGNTDYLYKSNETDAIEIFDANTGLEPEDNDVVVIQVWRSPGDAGDTLAVDARLHGIQVYYNTTSGTDD